MTFCSKCGASLEPNARFCDKCGEPQGVGEQQPDPAQAQAPPVYAQQPDPAQGQAPPAYAQQPDPAQGQAPPVYAQQPDPAQWQPPPGYPNQPPPPAQWQPPPAYAQQQYQPAVPAICSIFEAYRRAITILQRKPILLWGISLMFSLLCGIAVFFCWLPIIYIPVVATIEVGMISVFLAGYRGQPVSTAMLFTGFNDFKRIASGMLWMTLWIIIWALIPIVGFVFAIIKTYQYRFVPYLLLTDPSLNAADTLKRSMEMTKGYRGKLFGADIIVGVGVGVAMGILALLGQIPAVGFLFYILLFIFTLLVIMFVPLFLGLVQATLFDEVERVKKF